MRHKFQKAGALALLLMAMAGCNPPQNSQSPPDATIDRQPPPLPENAVTVDFNAAADEGTNSVSAEQDKTEPQQASAAWGLEPGEAIPLKWEDLMPEGAEEELARQEAEFFRMLEQRYAASATSLAEAQTFDEIQEGSAFDYMPQLGTFDVVDDLDGQLIRIPGYVVPFDFNESRRQGEFLFVPYMGACIHTPPPPPNQIIFVRADPAIRLGDIWSPYWLEGTLTTEVTHSEPGDAAYAVSLSKLESYEYR
ncbi:putative lipoprotein [Hyphomonas adhaerens MHS-3]|uniref:Putative lipoprotein n=2 Tax=Hyphomonas adhaerens TaxID=81029 RepID=A0A069E2W5_9PROT|nr:putative lipoprotein [Hyphomonas adhaerens MHS-3]